MRPIRLYIEDFMCYSFGFIDFAQFNSALIIGKIENNELYSNGVGKTTIFKAIEYVLFNQADVNLEKIIRDDASLCKIVMDFIIDGQEYRICRSRSKKGSTDVTLLQRNTIDSLGDEAYHTFKFNDIYQATSDDSIIKTYWKDIGGRRAADTEKELAKLIKTNFSAFRSTLHFLQNDFTGLSTVTPSKRKGILRDALELGIYAKLEKIAKEKAAAISKDIDKHKTLVENIGSPESQLDGLKNKLVSLESNIVSKQDLLASTTKTQIEQTKKLNDLINNHTALENKFSSLLTKNKLLASEKSKIETSIKEYQTKKSNAIKSAQILVEDVKNLKEEQTKLIEIDYSQEDVLLEKSSSIKEEITKCNLSIQSNSEKHEELNIPVPDDSVCKHCRQELTEEHKTLCKAKLSDEIKLCQDNIKNAKNMVTSLTVTLKTHQQAINSIILSKRKLDNISVEITAKSKEIQDKKSIYSEYKQLLDKFNSDLSDKLKEIEIVKEDLSKSSIEEANNIKNQINIEKAKLAEVSGTIFSINKEISDLGATKAVVQHSIVQINNDLIKRGELVLNLEKLDNKFAMYPHVVQSFSSIGIPNLIIQNVLDDLQSESNALLSQLKPGLQLSFVIEKTKSDGTQDDTLEIKYLMNGKERDYDQLSGAMKLSVIFSLKLGLSFLLQKMVGTDIRFLLLDEIDQSLDKAGVDAFAEIVKFFQKDFTILIITHNDRLKDKFSKYILVDQDINMISKAQVVSSW